MEFYYCLNVYELSNNNSRVELNTAGRGAQAVVAEISGNDPKTLITPHSVRNICSADIVEGLLKVITASLKMMAMAAVSDDSISECIRIMYIADQ